MSEVASPLQAADLSPEELERRVREAVLKLDGEAIRQLGRRYARLLREGPKQAGAIQRPPFQLVKDVHLDSLIEYSAESLDLIGWSRTPVNLLHMASQTLVSAIMG